VKSEINNELAKVNGVFAYKTSYAYKSEVDIKTIVAAINKTAYLVKSYEVVNLK